MPGNEFGERIHNFFGQEGISQDQHQSQVVDGSCSSFSNGLVGNQRQIDPSLIANLKSYSTQNFVDPEGGQSSNSLHGLNFTQQPIRSELSKSVLREHQQLTNGYMHGNLVLKAAPNEANFLGVDAVSSRDKLSATGFTPDLHPMRVDMGESPVNYDFFGGQQQLSSQLPGMLQPFPRQQMTFNDMQVHEYQMQQQVEARHRNSLNSNAGNGNCSSDNQSHQLVNGIPLQDASNNCWQPDLMTGNTNWMQPGISPGVQGSSTGLMITSERGHLAQKLEPSLHSMPVGGENAPQHAFSSVQINKLAVPHGSSIRSFSLTHQPPSFLNQGDVQDSHTPPRSVYQEKLLFSHTSVPRSNNRPNIENFRQDDSSERNISVPEKFGQMESSGLSERSFMKMPENRNASQKSTMLDPTEEKILFGSDDNLWDAFGSTFTGNLMSSSSDLYDACPSSQSGSWSALMQSAVAETSSDDAGMHEWGSMQQSVWATNNTAPHANSHIGSRTQDLGVKASNALSESLHSDFTPTAVQHLHDKGNKVSDFGPLEKSMGQRSKLAGNIFHSSSSGIDGQINSCSIQKNVGIEDRPGIWKVASNPNLAGMKEHKNHFTQNLQMQRENYRFGIAGAGTVSSGSRDVQGNIHRDLDNYSVDKAISQLKSRDGSPILESYACNNAGSNNLVNAHDMSRHGGKEAQSGHVRCRPSIPRKFQYHPMGNIDVTDEPCRDKLSHFGQSKSLGQAAIDEGHVSQTDLNCTNEAFKGMGSEYSRRTSASANRSVDTQVKRASLRLELLHKVSQEHFLETNVSGIPEAKTSVEYDGQCRPSPSSASQGFSLQLAPPSQPAPSPDNMQFSQNFLQPLNSLHTAPEKGRTTQSRFARWASDQSFPQQSSNQGPFLGSPGENNVKSGFPYSKEYQQNQLMPVASRQSAANHLVSSSSELSTPEVEERDECSDIDKHGQSAQTPSLLNPTTHNRKRDSAEGFPMLSTSQPLGASSSLQPEASSGMMSDSRSCLSAPQRRFGNQPSKPQPDILPPYPLPRNNIEGSFLVQEKANQLPSQNGGDMSLSGRDMVMQEFKSKDMGAKQTSDSSLPSSNLPRDSLLHNEHMIGSGDSDASKITVMRVDPQKLAPKGEQQLPSRSDCLVRDGLNHKQPPNHMLRFGEAVSQSFSNKNHQASAGADHQQISPQMAPSWYSQYGTFKNGLVQPVNETDRFTPLKIEEQSSNVGNSVDGSCSVQSSKQFNKQQMPESALGTETRSSDSLPRSTTEKFLKVEKPKKCRTATSELLSRNKEAMQSLQRLKTLGEAEVYWSRATKRFAERVEFETLLEDVSPIKSKRRLIYTTQLMQQIFCPPPARVISLVGSSNYESVAYTAARAVQGDVCSSTSTNRCECFSSPNSSSPLSVGTETGKISDEYISKAAEEFISRTWKLETDFAGLENGTTVSDLSVEIQDLEKFSVINRFARFHPTSSSTDRNLSSLRLNPQRYVTIAPMPQNIPDRVQCLSL